MNTKSKDKIICMCKTTLQKTWNMRDSMLWAWLTKYFMKTPQMGIKWRTKLVLFGGRCTLWNGVTWGLNQIGFTFGFIRPAHVKISQNLLYWKVHIKSGFENKTSSCFLAFFRPKRITIWFVAGLRWFYQLWPASSDQLQCSKMHLPPWDGF